MRSDSTSDKWNKKRNCVAQVGGVCQLHLPGLLLSQWATQHIEFKETERRWWWYFGVKTRAVLVLHIREIFKTEAEKLRKEKKVLKKGERF